MAKSRVFVKMLQRNNMPKIAIVLVYAILEWTLIALLLLDGLFSYFIAAFADFFGLEPPCFLCSHALGTIDELSFCSRHSCPASADYVSPKSEEKSLLAERSVESLVLSVKSEEKLVVDENSEEKLVLDKNSEEKLVVDANSEEILDLCAQYEARDVEERVLIVEDASAELIPHISTTFEERLVPVDLIDISTLTAAEIHEDEEFGEFQGVVASEEEDVKVTDTEANCEVSIGSEICDQDEPPLEFVQCKDIYNDDKLEKVQVFIEAEEERAPETPTSLDSISVASEFDLNELVTVDHLKSALKSERKALSALYSELEEERNASSVAANETMAMITRLQEEKAAMQMEAFQYQRMMEEQSEYDQEALQLLNDLVAKREREKQELEEELDMYRKKEIQNVALSSADDTNDLSSESHYDEDCDAFNNLLTLDDSLADFEEERFSIVKQLKAIEAKLQSLDDKDDSITINGHDLNGSDTNGKLYEKSRSRVSSGKSLLPLFDATTNVESEDGLNLNHTKFAIHNHDRHALAEEVESIYERLHALEADKEFIKQCIGSLRKGDKGMDLLQEILQHLRELRSVQLRVRNAGYALASLSA